MRWEAERNGSSHLLRFGAVAVAAGVIGDRAAGAMAAVPVIVPPRPRAVFELSAGVAFRQEDAVVLAAMVRSLACRREWRRQLD